MITIEHPTFLQQQVIDTLRTIEDPELGVSIWDLGFIYDLNIDDQNNITITMTLTAPNCPEAEHLPTEVKMQLEMLENVGKVSVNLTFEPSWTPDMMSESAKEMFDFLF